METKLLSPGKFLTGFLILCWGFLGIRIIDMFQLRQLLLGFFGFTLENEHDLHLKIQKFKHFAYPNV